MDKIISLLKQELDLVKENLSKEKENKQELIKNKNSLEDFLFLIELYKKFSLKKKIF